MKKADELCRKIRTLYFLLFQLCYAPFFSVLKTEGLYFLQFLKTFSFSTKTEGFKEKYFREARRTFRFPQKQKVSLEVIIY